MLSAAEIADLVAELDAIDGSDPESAHDQADDILLEAAPEDLCRAYARLVKRCGWWATA